MTDEVPLRHAPERFFDPEAWRLFLERFSSRAAALECLGRRDAGIFLYYEQQAAELPGPEGDEARRQTEIRQAAEALIDALKAQLIAGELVITGLLPPSADRVPVPADLLPALAFDFVAEKIVGGGYVFQHIRITEPMPPNRDLLLERCAAWLEARRPGSDTREKVLKAEAEAAFGPALKQRQFNAAYARVFGHRRGRPRSPR